MPAFFLKKFTLFVLKNRVILVEFSFETSFSGSGRKSLMTWAFSIASAMFLGVLLQLVFFLIPFPPFAPEAGAINTNAVFPVRKPTQFPFYAQKGLYYHDQVVQAFMAVRG